MTKIPNCRNIELVGGKKHVTSVPCFADSRGEKTVGGFRVTTYTVNQDADQWHLLYAWRHHGTLYTLSEHIAPPYTLPRIVQNMNRMMGSLVLVRAPLADAPDTEAVDRGRGGRGARRGRRSTSSSTS